MKSLSEYEYYSKGGITIYCGDCREILPGLEEGSVDTCITSPPYFGLRDYGNDGQIGLEDTPEDYVAKLVEAFRGVRRVLRDDGTLWLNLGDSYGTGASGQNFDPASGATNHGGQGPTGNFGHKKQAPVRGFYKQLIGIPWRVAFALQADGWYLRQDIIWHKPNSMPESVTDRCTKAHEYIFLLSKSQRYYYDAEAIAEETTDPEYRERGKIRPTAEGGVGFEIRGGLHAQIGGRLTRNKRSVWTVTTKPFKGAHFATFPPALIEPCVLAGCPEGGLVLDLFHGAGTTGMVAQLNARRYVGIELNAVYIELSLVRLRQEMLF
jgi:DNA modification methylase